MWLPGSLECRVEELLPLVAHVEHQAATQEQVLQPEAGRHAPVVYQVPELTVGARYSSVHNP